MGDWTLALGIVVCAVLWVQIFMDYRKKLSRIVPRVQEVSSRKEEISGRISAAENNVEDIRGSMEKLGREIDELEEQRRELQERINPLEMIYIPAGKFRLGSNAPGHEDEQPEHVVQIKAFYLDKTEVTNLHYKDFIDATGHRAPLHWRSRTFPDPRLADHPVVNVSWEDARVYAEWMGKRLPTEAEWERAAKGDRGSEYPWGRTCSPEYVNFANPEGKTTPVEQYSGGASDLGVWDLCGNVGEWVNDWYDSSYYKLSEENAEADPTGPPSGVQKVYRGGAYHCNRIDIRAAARHFALPTSSIEYIGFRCAMDAED